MCDAAISAEDRDRSEAVPCAVHYFVRGIHMHECSCIVSDNGRNWLTVRSIFMGMLYTYTLWSDVPAKSSRKGNKWVFGSHCVSTCLLGVYTHIIFPG
ncbi:hypothetical protein V5799_000223 [Amblyomma americanum]|uniref:Uncharacterized protein n=1 Tax=Amblyomma americanum TaxID=6943 RepID=A0AAQ4D3N6_AMBAM